MLNILKYLLLAMVPVVVMPAAVLAIFAYVGAGIDWQFVGFTAALSAMVGVGSGVCAWLEDARY